MITIGIDTALIPFVATGNDDDIARPFYYLSGKKRRKDREDEEKAVDWFWRELLAETPRTQMQKERVRYYLRRLQGRFLKGETIFLYVFFVTRGKKRIDSSNVVDFIQNAGNKLIWKDDSQIADVRSRRGVGLRLYPDWEATIVYVGAIPKDSVGDVSKDAERFREFTEYVQYLYDIEKRLAEHFDQDEQSRFYRDGFWKDPRFMRIPALSPLYEKWLVKQG